MSNFTGVTFAQQKVLPSDDAIIRRHILSDGILFGCELSYSGSTLTMAAGQILACGRQFRHPSSQNWAVVDATSGYARLLLTMDLTKTSTKETFDQIEDRIEYASSADGFPDLEQSNVNVSGTRYQVVACVVSLGTGGITGIVSQLGPCEVAGGGGLNFSVVGGLTQPAGPKANMIWVATDADITGYALSATEPAAPEEGMVWITIGTFSAVSFNALKKNTLMVYPLSAKQYIGSTWVDVTAKIYQNGAWADWAFLLLNKGAFASGYEFAIHAGYGEVSQPTGCARIKITNNAYLSAFSPQQIDVTNYQSAEITVSGGKSKYPIRFGLTAQKSVHDTEEENIFEIASAAFAPSGYNVPSGTQRIDLSAVSGAFWFGCTIAGTLDLDDDNYGCGGLDIVDIVFK